MFAFQPWAMMSYNKIILIVFIILPLFTGSMSVVGLQKAYAGDSQICVDDSDCGLFDACTFEMCDQGTCVSGVPGDPVPDCCSSDSQCQDIDACTLGVCDIENNVCIAGPPKPDCCTSDSQCQDFDACTPGVCDQADNNCKPGTPDPDCCTSDSQCQDIDACTPGVCDIVNDVCIAGPSNPDCCTSDSQCQDFDACTPGVCDIVNDVCIAGPSNPDCCTSDSQCNDDNACTNDVCNLQNNLCEFSDPILCLETKKFYTETEIDIEAGDFGEKLNFKDGDQVCTNEGAQTVQAVIHPKKGTISSYNPGQYYAVTKVTANQDLDSVWIFEDDRDCTQRDLPYSSISKWNPAKVPGGAYVAMMCDEVTVDLTSELAKSGALFRNEDTGVLEAHVDDVKEGCMVFLGVKYSPGLKGETLDTLEPEDLSCENWEFVEGVTESGDVFTDSAHRVLEVIKCGENEEENLDGDCVCKPGFEETPSGICVAAEL